MKLVVGMFRLLCSDDKAEVILITLKRNINDLPEDVFYRLRYCISVKEYIICPASFEIEELRKMLKDYAIVGPYPCDALNELTTMKK